MSKMHLLSVNSDLKKIQLNVGFGEGLKRAGELDENVVAACADLTGSTKISIFADAFPDRFIEIGVAEQNLVTVGSGLAAMGKIPFVSSYAAFSPGRNWEQIRTTICLNEQPVKIVGAHAGLMTSPDGATHQMLEDIALMRVLPNMVVVCPADSVEAFKATLALAADKKNPGYIRLVREPLPVFTTEETPFELGKAQIFSEGSDISIISTGSMTHTALAAAEKLFKDGIDAEVVHVATIKPLDNATILKSVQKTGLVITVEEAQINGGLGGAVAELLGENFPVPLRRIGVKDEFGESGTPEELLKKHGLTEHALVLAAHGLLGKK
ncbi:MAG: transketolase family protein [bacterium]|nr:transketolase family protein [bacterium]